MPKGGELASKVRAARAYSGKSLPTIGKELNWSRETFSRVERGKRGLGPDELEAVAKACGVHTDFFGVNITKPLEPPTDEPILERILSEVQHHRAHVADAVIARGEEHSQLVEAISQLDRAVRQNGDAIRDLQDLAQRVEQMLNPRRFEAIDQALEGLAGLQAPPKPPAAGEDEDDAPQASAQ